MNTYAHQEILSLLKPALKYNIMNKIKTSKGYKTEFEIMELIKNIIYKTNEEYHHKKNYGKLLY
jgi:hypothetical protein